MSKKKRKAKLIHVAAFHAEALRLVGNISASQRRLFEVAAAHGKELEPIGLLAGKRR